MFFWTIHQRILKNISQKRHNFLQKYLAAQLFVNLDDNNKKCILSTRSAY